MTTLKASELTCGYPGHAVLERLSLEANCGEVLVLLGPNGSGKTTLLRSLARLLRPESGTVSVFGQDAWSYRPHAFARDVVLSPQSERRDWPLSVEQCVRLGRSPHRGWMLPLNHDDLAAVEQALATTGLLELRDRPITEISGGEWRRMILARSLAQQARVLLLDEPTAGLDLKYQVEVLRLVRRLADDEQLTVVVTLHDLNHASLYGDRFALLSRRKIAAVGSARDVLTATRISEVYSVAVTVIEHPVYHTPMVVPLLEAEPE